MGQKISGSLGLSFWPNIEDMAANNSSYAESVKAGLWEICGILGEKKRKPRNLNAKGFLLFIAAHSRNRKIEKKEEKSILEC